MSEQNSEGQGQQNTGNGDPVDQPEGTEEDHNPSPEAGDSGDQAPDTSDDEQDSEDSDEPNAVVDGDGSIDEGGVILLMLVSGEMLKMRLRERQTANELVEQFACLESDINEIVENLARRMKIPLVGNDIFSNVPEIFSLEIVERGVTLDEIPEEVTAELKRLQDEAADSKELISDRDTRIADLQQELDDLKGKMAAIDSISDEATDTAGSDGSVGAAVSEQGQKESVDDKPGEEAKPKKKTVGKKSAAKKK